MGINRLLGFKKMIMALTVKDYTKAAIEALDSRWATQVGGRAQDVALMIRDGK
jgi:lysozyme